MLELLPIEPADTPPGLRARASGDWSFAALSERRDLLDALAARLAAAPRVEWDLSRIEDLDDAGALWLARASRGAAAVTGPPLLCEHVAQAARALEVPRERRPRERFAIPVRIGSTLLHALGHLRDATRLLGIVALDAALFARRPGEIPWLEISANLYRCGVTALPVTLLVGFLLGIVLTYLSALQLQPYGADLLVINIVAIGIVRELGPMLASIIAAGRSGSTMTAQLGVMRVTEEIEALAVMGIPVSQRLVLPKVIGLALALPLVTFCTNLAGLAGAMLVCQVTLDIPFAAFLEALPRVLDISHLWLGLAKSAVFGFTVAFVACHYGLRILPNTESLGIGVTRSVVAAITSVILLDAVFAILFRNVGF